jgi:uncharacterized protein (TIGR03083 family)
MAAAAKLDKTQLWELIHEQRRKVGDMLGTLDDTEWNLPSLCAGWRVRDVAAHCIETHVMTPAVFMGRFAGAAFRFHAMSEKNVERHRSQTLSEVLAQYRSTMSRTTSPPGPPLTWLAEAVIHGEDMARPAGRRVDVSPQALVHVLSFARRTSPLLHGKQRSAGLRLVATDVDWSEGDGPEVRGPAASLILAVTGRRAAVEALSGDGVATLRGRT